MPHSITIFVRILLLLLLCNNALAENALPSEIQFLGVEGELLENVQKHVSLYHELNSGTDLSEREFRRLRNRSIAEIEQALAPYGYYRSEILIDADRQTAKLVYHITLNRPVKLASVNIDLGTVERHQVEFADWLASYPLSAGDILVQPEYEAAKKSLLASALRLGYFDAKFSSSNIVIEENRLQADIELVFAAGPRYSISSIEFDWRSEERTDNEATQFIKPEILNPLISVKQGELYDASTLIDTQSRLLNTPYFSNVSVLAGTANADNATAPIIIDLTPSKRQAYSLEAGVGTDTGIRGGVAYENRRVNRKGHHLNFRLGGSEIKRSAILNYRIPLRRSPKDNFNVFGVLEEEDGDNRRFKQNKLGIELQRKWHSSLLKFGLTASQESFVRGDDSLLESEQNTDLLMPSFDWQYSQANDPLFPSKGWSTNLKLRAADQNLGSDIDLAQAILDTKALYPLGKGRLKIRLKLATSIINESSRLPESLGFLAGGDDSVRGYRYESIGVARNNATVVGKNLIVGSVEYQYPIKSKTSLVTFFDLGDAFDNNADYKRGAGVGLRWRLPFGALRLDLASALDRDGDPVRLHFSFGTDL